MRMRCRQGTDARARPDLAPKRSQAPRARAAPAPLAARLSARAGTAWPLQPLWGPPSGWLTAALTPVSGSLGPYSSCVWNWSPLCARARTPLLARRRVASPTLVTRARSPLSRACPLAARYRQTRWQRTAAERDSTARQLSTHLQRAVRALERLGLVAVCVTLRPGRERGVVRDRALGDGRHRQRRRRRDHALVPLAPDVGQRARGRVVLHQAHEEVGRVGVLRAPARGPRVRPQPAAAGTRARRAAPAGETAAARAPVAQGDEVVDGLLHLAHVHDRAARQQQQVVEGVRDRAVRLVDGRHDRPALRRAARARSAPCTAPRVQAAGAQLRHGPAAAHCTLEHGSTWGARSGAARRRPPCWTLANATAGHARQGTRPAHASACAVPAGTSRCPILGSSNQAPVPHGEPVTGPGAIQRSTRDLPGSASWPPTETTQTSPDHSHAFDRPGPTRAPHTYLA